MSSAAAMFIQKRDKYASIKRNLNPHGNTRDHVAHKVKKVESKARAA
jgi:hypothetical protein